MVSEDSEGLVQNLCGESYLGKSYTGVKAADLPYGQSDDGDGSEGGAEGSHQEQTSHETKGLEHEAGSDLSSRDDDELSAG